ncbi:MAG: DNA-binding NarL/FixJ family response regulator [Crocinitomicaceae bacterium]|jgi:DNA-binding NarL/FixJ family response regulator
MENKIRIALADDHKLFRSGLISILESTPNYMIVHEASNGQELLDGLATSKPDVILLDLEMPVLTGSETLQVIRKTDSEVKILLLTMHENDAFIYQMMEFGANGYLSKNTDPGVVIEAIQQVYTSGYYFSNRVSMAMLNGISDQGMSPKEQFSGHGLTARELEVLNLICKEHTTIEIGELLFLSPKTIEGYRKLLMEKTGSRNMAGLVLFSVKHGLLSE